MSIYIYSVVLFSLSCFTLLTKHEDITVQWYHRFFTMILMVPIYGRIFGWF